MDIIKDLTLLLARICMSSLFLWTAVEMLFSWTETVAYMKQRRFPYASLSLPLAVLILLLGGLSILLGCYIRIGAALLIAFLIPAAVRFHDFWNLLGSERQTQKILFMKDIAIFGSLLLILVWGGGRFSMN